MRLIIGLGNPGEQYQKTRHNLGFLVVKKIAQKKEIVFRLESMYEAKFAEMGKLDNRIKLVQPQTFMNESGRAVGKIKNYYKVDSEDIWVIHDDVDLELGKIRISLGGTSAGHKGIQSIIDHLGPEFWRVRVGVGRDEKIPTEAWVLKNFDNPKIVADIVDKVADLVLNLLSNKIQEQTINVEAQK